MKTHRDEEELPSEFPFEPEASYEDLNLKKVEIPRRPSIVPSLNFEGLPEYITTSEDEGEEDEQD